MVLDKIAPGQSTDLMVGFETSDDAAVYRLSDDMAALLTVDFFTPIVDDAYDFGRIAAANSLSDVYAMGGSPHSCVDVLALPEDVPEWIPGDILNGAIEKIVEAGAVRRRCLYVWRPKQSERFQWLICGLVNPCYSKARAGLH